MDASPTVHPTPPPGEPGALGRPHPEAQGHSTCLRLKLSQNPKERPFTRPASIK